MNKKDVEKYINLISNRTEVEKVNSIIVNDFENSLKIYFTITKDYAKKYNLDFLHRVFEYNPKIPNLSHTREYANVEEGDYNATMAL